MGYSGAVSTPSAAGSEEASSSDAAAARFAEAFRYAVAGDYRRAAIAVDLRDVFPAIGFDALDGRAGAFHDAAAAMLFARQAQPAHARSLFTSARSALVALGERSAMLALVLAHARFELLWGDLRAARHMLHDAVDRGADAEKPEADAIDRLRIQLALLAGDVAAALECETRFDAATTVSLAIATNDIETIAEFGRTTYVERLIVKGALGEAFDLAAALMQGRREGKLEFDAARLMTLVLRGIADPLDAVFVLVDVAEHGRIDDAEEAAALLGVQATRSEFTLVRALHLLARAYLDTRHRRDSAGVAHSADAARLFTEIGARTLQARAMDVLVSTSSSVPYAVAKQPGKLTRRQRQIVALLRVGTANKGIANALGISEHTVERHVSAILDELDLRSRWQLLDPYSHVEEQP